MDYSQIKSQAKPIIGQLCQLFKGHDSVFPLKKNIDTMVSESLEPGDIILIIKTEYNDELGSCYVEFLRDSKLFYTYFYEQVFCFWTNESGDIHKIDEQYTSYNLPWVSCE